MTSYGKTVILKDWGKNSKRKYIPKKGINVAYHRIDKQNKEWYATFMGSSIHKETPIFKDDINRELSKLSKSILSDRARTIKTRPQYQIINGIKEVVH